MTEQSFDLEAYIDQTAPQTLEPRVIGGATRMIAVAPRIPDQLKALLTSALEALKANAADNQIPQGCAYCQRDTPASGCDDGWRYGASGASMCGHRRTHLEMQRMASAMSLIGLDETKFAKGWKQLDLTHESWRTAHAIASKLKEIRGTGCNLFFWGGLGRGKTHAALLLIREALRQRMSAVHTQWSEFSRLVRATYQYDANQSEHHLMRAVIAPDILLIDEIKDDLTDFSKRLLSDIIQQRDNALKPTIITANLTPEELTQTLEQRCADRFRSRCMDVLFDGEKYRNDEVSSIAGLQASILERAAL